MNGCINVCVGRVFSKIIFNKKKMGVWGCVFVVGGMGNEGAKREINIIL